MLFVCVFHQNIYLFLMASTEINAFWSKCKIHEIFLIAALSLPEMHLYFMFMMGNDFLARIIALF